MSGPPITKRQAACQLLFCVGCCCGRTDRGRPPVPVEQLKEIWRTEKLNRVVQLTISGCLGPCDLANVTLVLTDHGQMWLGGLHGETLYDRLIAWARACAAAAAPLPLPLEFQEHAFQRFQLKEEHGA